MIPVDVKRARISEHHYKHVTVKSTYHEKTAISELTHVNIHLQLHVVVQK